VGFFKAALQLLFPVKACVDLQISRLNEQNDVSPEQSKDSTEMMVICRACYTPAKDSTTHICNDKIQLVVLSCYFLKAMDRNPFKHKDPLLELPYWHYRRTRSPFLSLHCNALLEVQRRGSAQPSHLVSIDISAPSPSASNTRLMAAQLTQGA
jgi:hypothetical protein